MKKLYLTSFVFTTGGTEYKEQRIVLVTKEDREEYLKYNKLQDDFDLDIASAKSQQYFKSEFPESELLSIVTSRTIDIAYKGKHYDKGRKATEERVNIFHEKRVRGLLHEFWNSESDMCPLEASVMEDQERAWQYFIDGLISE